MTMAHAAHAKNERTIRVTDEELEPLLPVVDEFIDAVGANDAGFIAASLGPVNRAPVFAVVCARRLLDAEAVIADQGVGVKEARRAWMRAKGENEKLRRQIAGLKRTEGELREIQADQAKQLAKYRTELAELKKVAA